MSIFKSLFRKEKKDTSSASLAKDRLKVAISKECNSKNPLINLIENEVIDAITNYAKVNPENVETNIEKEIEILRLNCEIEKELCKKEENSVFLKLFNKKKDSASLAKDRLKFIIEKQSSPDFIKQLSKDVKEIVKKHIKYDPKNIQIEILTDEDVEYLEVNINIPEEYVK